MIISIVGNICSGKTTLAKKISSLYNFTYIPYKRTELSFLDNFFEDIPKHFFATQTSFLINKVTEIEDQNKKNNIVIDRSLYEDINIFAQYWMDNYPIDKKEKNLYKNLSDYLLTTIPQSDIYILCNCDKKTILERFNKGTKRAFEEKYPNDYIAKLCSKYESIIFPDNAIVVEVDTKNLDIRDDNIVMSLMSSILYHINYNPVEQMSLFEHNTTINDDKPLNNPHIKIHNPTNVILPENIFKVKKKCIYLAAPFTEFATIEPPSLKNNQIKIVPNEKRDYNILPDNYQRLLKKIKRLLSCNEQFDVLLPHKDENNWGKTYISNKQIIEAMISNMKSSDLIVAIISNSIGVHMEIAMMSVQNKPMVLIVIDDLTSGFYADGFKSQENVMVLHVKSIENVYEALNNDDLKSFIRRELKNEEKLDTK